MYWIAAYPVDNTIHPLNNRSLIGAQLRVEPLISLVLYVINMVISRFSYIFHPLDSSLSSG